MMLFLILNQFSTRRLIDQYLAIGVERNTADGGSKRIV